jgi:hypothetical protein
VGRQKGNKKGGSGGTPVSTARVRDCQLFSPFKKKKGEGVYNSSLIKLFFDQ